MIAAYDLIIRGFLAQIVVLRDRGQNRNVHGFGESLRFARAVVFVDHQTRDTDIAAQFAEIFHRRADVIGHIQRLQVVRPDQNNLLRHVARNRQTKAPANHVAQEIQQDIIKVPVMEAQLFQQFEPVDDPAPAATATDFGSAQFHGEHAVTLVADVPDLNFLARQFLAGGGLNNRRARLATKQQRCGVGFWVAADQQHALAHFGHHA